MLNPTKKIPPEPPAESEDNSRDTLELSFPLGVAGVEPRYQSTVVLAAGRAGLQLWVKQGGTARVIVQEHALVPDGMGAFFVLYEEVAL